MSHVVVVFDTVVFVRALLNPQSFWGKLVFVHAKDYTLVVSPATTRELVEVLMRPRLARRVPFLAQLDVTRALPLLEQAEVITPETNPTLSRDAKDNRFLALTRAAGADYLVTADRDLLDLHAYHGTQIITGQEFYATLQEQRLGEKRGKASVKRSAGSVMLRDYVVHQTHISTVSSKRQVALPAAMLRYSGMKPGDRVGLIVQKGILRITRATPVKQHPEDPPRKEAA
jgi:putative PIN family toxin of toxin-antitoxin system